VDNEQINHVQVDSGQASSELLADVNNLQLASSTLSGTATEESHETSKLLHKVRITTVPTHGTRVHAHTHSTHTCMHTHMRANTHKHRVAIM